MPKIHKGVVAGGKRLLEEPPIQGRDGPEGAPKVAVDISSRILQVFQCHPMEGDPNSCCIRWNLAFSLLMVVAELEAELSELEVDAHEVPELWALHLSCSPKVELSEPAPPPSSMPRAQGRVS